jgi:hypothetical protein
MRGFPASQEVAMTVNALLMAAMVLFLVAATGVTTPYVHFGWLGLAFLAAASLWTGLKV